MNDMLEQIIKLFKEKYEPATSIANATDFLDTNEIYDTIEKIIPGSDIKKEDLFRELQSQGYSFGPEPGKINFNLKWLLIRKY